MNLKITSLVLAFLMITMSSANLISGSDEGRSKTQTPSLTVEEKISFSSGTNDVNLRTSAIGSMLYDSSLIVNSGTVCVLSNAGKVFCDSDMDYNPEPSWNNHREPFSGIIPLDGRVKSIQASGYDDDTCALYYDGNITCWSFDNAETIETSPKWYGEEHEEGLSNLNLPGPVLTFAFSEHLICYVLANNTAECSSDLLNETKSIPYSVKQVVVSGYQVCVNTWENQMWCGDYSSSGEHTLDFSNNGVSAESYLMSASSSLGEIKFCRAESFRKTDCTGYGYGMSSILSMANGGYTGPWSNRQFETCFVNTDGELNGGCSTSALNQNNGDYAGPLQGSPDRYCVITRQSSVVCWGEGDHSRLNNGTPVEAMTPFTPSIFLEPEFVAEGAAGSLADRDQDGIIDAFDSTFDVITKKQSFDAGYAHTCAIDDNSNLHCWGRNANGQLGIESTTDAPLSTRIDIAHEYKSVSAGFAHTCAITLANTLQCWGSNAFGQVGISTPSQLLEPTDVLLDGQTFYVSAVETGGNHTCAINTTHALYCWGSNSNGQLGVGSQTDSATPKLVFGDLKINDVATGDAHSCAIIDGEVTMYANGEIEGGGTFCWGENVYGQLGIGTNLDQNTPTRSVWGSFGALIFAGEHHTCVHHSQETLLESPWLSEIEGHVKCTGDNRFGQLGDNSLDSKTDWVETQYLGSTHTPIFHGKVTVGWNHNCGAHWDTVRCWGSNSTGQLGWSNYQPNQLPALATHSPGAIYAGTNYFGTLTAGGSHTCVVGEWSSIACVGSNSNGQLGRLNTTLGLSEYPKLALTDSFNSIKIADNLRDHNYHAATNSKCWVTEFSEAKCIMSTSQATLFDPAGIYDQTGLMLPNLGQNIVDVQSTENMVCALYENSSISCIGALEWDMNDFSLQAWESSIPSDVDQMILGERVLCGVLSNKSVVCEGKYHGSEEILDYRRPMYPAYTDNISQLGSIIDLAIVSKDTQNPSHSTICGVFEFGDVSCWGSAVNHLAGRGGERELWDTGTTLPQLTADLPNNFKPISIQSSDTGFCVISDLDEVACWGQPLSAVSGIYTSEPTIFPYSLPISGPLMEFSAGGNTACALYTNEDLYCAKTIRMNGTWVINSTQSWVLISSDVSKHTHGGNGICFSANQTELHCIIGGAWFGYWGSGTTKQYGETFLEMENKISKSESTDFDLDGFLVDAFPHNPALSKQCSNGEFGAYWCELIPPGYIFDGNSVFPKKCEPGTYQSEYGQSQCIEASPGHYNDQFGADKEKICLKGTYQPNYGSTSCLAASPGNYTSTNGSINQFQCLEGTFEVDEGSNGCDLANPGHYVDQMGSSNQTPCPSGTFLPDYGADSLNDCITTPPGNYSEQGWSEPQLCNWGTYQPNSSASACLPASRGHYVNTSGLTEQYPCLPGTYQPNEGSVGCWKSQSGHYVNTTGSTEQTPCQPGTYQPNYSSTECIITTPGNSSGIGYSTPSSCNRGTYQPYSNMSYCYDAGFGFYVDQTQSLVKYQCPMGQSTVANTSRGVEDCEDSAVGNYVPIQGGPETQCEPGTYQSKTKQTSCELADVGFYVSDFGMASQLPCISGTYQSISGQSGCLESEIGFYVESAGATAQIPCPDGFSTNETGSTSIIECSVIVSEKSAAEIVSSNIGTFGVFSGLAFLVVLAVLVFMKLRNRNDEDEDDEDFDSSDYYPIDEESTQSTETEEREQDHVPETQEEQYVTDENGTQWYEDGDGVWWYWDEASETWLEHNS